jgi:DNA invertase Pin-like site-specific DNA recombinase
VRSTPGRPEHQRPDEEIAVSETHPTRSRGLIYTRVSDEKQSGASSQLTGARRIARLNNLEVAAEIEDDGLSGDDMSRAGLAEVLATLEREHRRRQPVAWLVIDQSDRLSRADSLKTFSLLERMRGLGVRRIATPARTFDLCNALDLTLLQIEIDHKNNPFLKDLGRRVLNGMLDAAREGYWTGQKPPLGYKVVHTPGEHGVRRRASGKLAIDPETAPVVRELFDRYLRGESTRDLVAWLAGRIGRRLCRKSLQAILQNETYTGTRVFGRRTRAKHARLSDGAAKIPEPGDDGPGDAVRIAAYPALIDEETFRAVQVRLATGRSRGRKKEWNNREKEQPAWSVNPLAGLCRCGACGSPMYSSRKGPYPYLVCRKRHEEGGEACPTTGLTRGDVALRRVLATLADRLLQGDAVSRLVELAGQAEDETRKAHEQAEASAVKALETCDARLARARRRLAEADDDLLEEYQKLVRELKEEKAACEADLARLRAEEPVAEEGDAELFARWLDQCRSLCEGAEPAGTPEQQNAVLRELLAEVRVFPPLHPRRGDTVGRVEVVLPEWLSRVLATTAGRAPG